MRVPSPTSRSHKRVYLSLWDLAWAGGSPLLALYLRDPEIFSRTDLSSIGYFWLLSASFAVLAFYAFKIHDNMTPYFSVHDAIDIAEAVLFVELLTFVSLFTVNRFDGIPRSIPLFHGLLLAAAVFAARIFIRIVSSSDEPQPDFRCSGERMILIGANPVAGLFIRLLSAYAPKRQHVVALLDADATMIGRAIAGVQVVGEPRDLDALIKEYAIHGITVSRVVIAGEVDFLAPVVLREIERVCERQRINLSFLPRMVGLTDRSQGTIAPEPIAAAKPSIALPSYVRFKRPIDIIASLLLLILLAPLMTVAAALVFMDVGFPVLFWQERVGWNRRSFLIYKFRTLASPFDSDGKPLAGAPATLCHRRHVAGHAYRRAAAIVERAIWRHVVDRAPTAAARGSAGKCGRQAIGASRHQRLGASQRCQTRQQGRQGKAGRVVCPQCVAVAGFEHHFYDP